MAKNNNDIKEELIDLACAGGGFIVGGGVTGMLKPEKGFDYTPFLELAGGFATTFLSKNRRLRSAGMGLALRGGIRLTGRVFPKMRDLSGLDGCGCGCGGKCGCGDQDKKALQGLGNVYDPVNRFATGTVNGGVIKTGVSRADLLTLPGANNALIDKTPNTTTNGGFFFNRVPQNLNENPLSNQWDVIYNFFPNFFARIASMNMNLGTIAKFYIEPRGPRSFNGAIQDAPLDCAIIGWDYTDGSQVQEPYTSPGDVLRDQQWSPCAWGKGNCTGSVIISPEMVIGYQNDRVTVGEPMNIRVVNWQPETFVYLLEFSDGSRFYLSVPEIAYIWRMPAAKAGYRLWIWNKKGKQDGKVCVTSQFNTLTVLPASATVEPESPAGPVTVPTPDRPARGNTNTTTPPFPNAIASLQIVGDDEASVGQDVLITGIYGLGVDPKALRQPIRWEWDFGDGSTLITPTPEVYVSYDRPDVYTVTLCAVFAGSDPPLCNQHVIRVSGGGTPPPYNDPPPPPPSSVITPPVIVPPLLDENGDVTPTGGAVKLICTDIQPPITNPDGWDDGIDDNTYDDPPYNIDTIDVNRVIIPGARCLSGDR